MKTNAWNILVPWIALLVFAVMVALAFNLQIDPLVILPIP